jgi:hypothetical protein
MKFIKYSYNSGKEVVSNSVLETVEYSLRDVKVPIKSRKASIIRNSILDYLHQKGWSDQVRINAHHSVTLTSTYRRIGLCLQTGNMARFYADLMKLQSQFLNEKIDVAIYILPTVETARILGSNMANYERLTSELMNLFRKVITIPMIIYGFY